MSERPRGPALVRLLLVTGGLATSLGCSCDWTTVRTLSEAEYRAYRTVNGNTLGDAACASLCLGGVVAPTGASHTAPWDTSTGGVPIDTGFGRTSSNETTYYDGDQVISCRLVRIDWNTPGVQCEMTDPGCGIGRRPEGLGPLTPPDRSLGVHFARIAQLEAASVVAFERVAEELRGHGAPHDLVRWAMGSAADEARHAEQMAGLARRYGVEPTPASVAPASPRSLVDLAIENAVEGCVGEALGAMLAAHAARHATDPEVRRVMEAIAADEAQHAALSFAIDDWIQPQLSPAERTRVQRALGVAVARQRSAHAPRLPPPARARSGAAPQAVVDQWLEQLSAELWPAAA